MAEGGGTKIDEIFVDFRVRFDKAEQDAQRINAEMAKMGKVAGVAADASQRWGLTTKEAFVASRKELKEAEKQFDRTFGAAKKGADEAALSFRRIAQDIKRANADFAAGSISARDHATALSFARREAIELRRGGLAPAGRELTAFNQIMMTTQARGATAGRSFGHMRGSLTTLLVSLTALPGPLGRVASSLLLFGIGGTVTVAVLAGITAIAAAWRALTKDSREARKAMQEAREEAQKLLAGEQPELALRRTREGVQAALDAADERVAAARRGRLALGMRGPDGGVVLEVDQEELNKALIERNKIVRELTAVTRAQTEAAAKDAENRQQAIAAEIQGLTQLQQLHALEASDLERARRLHSEIVTLLEQENTIIGRAQLESLANALAGPAGLLPTGRTRQELAAAMQTARELRATVVDINSQLGLRGFDVGGRPIGSALAEFEGQLGGIRAARRGALGLGAGQGAFSAEEELRAQRALLQLDRERADQVHALAAAEAELADTLREIRDLEQQIAETIHDSTDRGQAVRVALTNQLRQAFGKLYQATVRVDKAMKGLDASSSSFLETVQGAALALRALNRVADAAGFVDQDLRRAVDSALDLFQVIEQLQSAKSLTTGQTLALGAGLLSAGVGLVMGIGNALFGESEREKMLRENTEQLARLANSAEALGAVMGRVTGSMGSPTLAAIDRAERERRPLNPDEFDRGDVSAEDLALIEAAAEAFGITIDDSIESLDQLRQAINEIDFARLAESFAGAMDLLRREFELFDIDDPIAQVERLREHLLEFTNLPLPFRQLIAGADLTTAEGRAQLEALMRALFQMIQSGALGPDVLGEDMSLADFLDLLGQIESTLDEVAAGTDGEADNFARSSRITEVQGAAIVAILDTMNFRAGQQVRLGEQSVSELERIRAILDRSAPPPPAVPNGNGHGGDELPVNRSVNVHLGGVTVQGGGDPQAIGAAVADHVATAIDERLRELQRRKQRAGGA